MSDRNLLPQTRRVQIGAATVAGTGDTVTFTEFDMKGGPSGPVESVIATVLLGAITATGVATLRVKESDVAGTYGAGTIDLILKSDGTVHSVSATTGDSNKVLSLEVFRPSKRYLRFELVRATANIVILGVLAEGYNPANTILTQATGDGYAATAIGNNISTA